MRKSVCAQYTARVYHRAVLVDWQGAYLRFVDPEPGDIVGGRWRVHSRIAAGNFQTTCAGHSAAHLL